jgi:hypothetical protein
MIIVLFRLIMVEMGYIQLKIASTLVIVIQIALMDSLSSSKLHMHMYTRLNLFFCCFHRSASLVLEPISHCWKQLFTPLLLCSALMIHVLIFIHSLRKRYLIIGTLLSIRIRKL